MDILIKNMEMPSERIMLEVFPDGKVFEIHPTNNARIPTEAEAIELPPHGDLVRYLDVKNAIIKAVGKDNNLWCDIMDVVDEDAPTILEASNGTDN